MRKYMIVAYSKENQDHWYPSVETLTRRDAELELEEEVKRLEERGWKQTISLDKNVVNLMKGGDTIKVQIVSLW